MDNFTLSITSSNYPMCVGPDRRSPPEADEGGLCVHTMPILNDINHKFTNSTDNTNAIN